MNATSQSVVSPATLDPIVDLDTYPISQPGTPAYHALLDRCRKQLQDDGCVVLKGFVRADALAALGRETESLAPRAHYNQTRTNPYNSDGDPSLPPDHPKNVFSDRTNGFVAGDLIGAETMIRRLYQHPDFQRFIAATVDVPTLYEYADPLAGLVVNVLRGGCQHPWHYDTNEFIVSMMTKQPEGGGEFEYCPRIRNPESENFPAVQQVLQGNRGAVKSLTLEPGDVQIFYGRYSLHRVVRVEGARDRHTVIFGYAREPGFIGRADRTRRIFGRIAPIHERQEREGVSRSDNLAD